MLYKEHIALERIFVDTNIETLIASYNVKRLLHAYDMSYLSRYKLRFEHYDLTNNLTQELWLDFLVRYLIEYGSSNSIEHILNVFQEEQHSIDYITYNHIIPPSVSIDNLAREINTMHYDLDGKIYVDNYFSSGSIMVSDLNHIFRIRDASFKPRVNLYHIVFETYLAKGDLW